MNQLIRMRGLFAATIQNNEVNHFLQLREPIPPRQLLNVVFTDQAVEGRVGFASANILNSVDRV